MFSFRNIFTRSKTNNFILYENIKQFSLFFYLLLFFHFSEFECALDSLPRPTVIVCKSARRAGAVYHAYMVLFLISFFFIIFIFLIFHVFFIFLIFLIFIILLFLEFYHFNTFNIFSFFSFYSFSI